MNSTTDNLYADLLSEIRKVGSSAMVTVYRAYKESYLSFTHKYSKDQELRLQSYNDAIVQLYRAIVTKQYDPDKSQLKTYLFSIGKNKLINRLNTENTYNKNVLLSDKLPEKNIQDWNHFDSEKNDINSEIKIVFDQLGNKCQELLKLFYFDALDSEEIAELMNYDSVNVVYSAKSRCLKSIKELIIKNRE